MLLLQWCDVRVPPVWEAMAPFLVDALSKGGDRDWGLEDIYRQALDKKVHVMALVEDDELLGAGVIEITDSPRRRMLNVHLLGTRPNTYDRWKGIMEKLQDLARAYDCKAITGTGRPGWGRKLGATRELRVWEIDL